MYHFPDHNCRPTFDNFFLTTIINQLSKNFFMATIFYLWRLTFVYHSSHNCCWPTFNIGDLSSMTVGSQLLSIIVQQPLTVNFRQSFLSDHYPSTFVARCLVTIVNQLSSTIFYDYYCPTIDEHFTVIIVKQLSLVVYLVIVSTNFLLPFSVDVDSQLSSIVF